SPIYHVLVLAGAAGRIVGPKREEVIVAVLAGDTIEVGAAPWVERDALRLEIGSVPLAAIWLLDQYGESLLFAGVMAGVEQEEVERDADPLDVDSRRVGFSLREVFQ